MVAATAERKKAKPAGALPLTLGPLGGVLGFHIAQAAVTTVTLFERHVGEPLGLRKVEFSILMLLLANGPLSPKRLAQALVLSAPSLTLLLDRLQERDIVKRERSEVDRRSQNICLTPAGDALARKAAEAAVPMEHEVLTRLSAAEQAMLIELLRKVAQP
jgi:DNA-binding MarR family transcriptional regulator